MLLEIENLSFTYPNGVSALKNISFRVEEGEKLAVLGPNGAGKSTLLLSIAGLAGTKGREGSIRWLSGEGKTVEAGRLGFLFQNPDDQIIGTTVEDDVGFILLKNNVDSERAQGLVREALRQVHLEGYEKRVPLDMSFGEKRRMGLAGILIGRPDLLLLDEPSLGLDHREKSRIIDILVSLPRTVLMASMDLELVARLADRVLLLDGGELIARGSPAEIFSQDALLLEHGLKIFPEEKLQ